MILAQDLPDAAGASVLKLGPILSSAVPFPPGSPESKLDAPSLS